jgi:hypothetical protein
MAHMYEKRNNFKDFGVQCYGGILFNKKIDFVNDVFDNTKPPTPTRRVIDSTTGRQRAAPTSMSSYNNCYGPCFAPDMLITMYNGTKKPCRELKKGDIIKEIDGIKINKFSDLSGYLSTKRPGDKVNVTYSRENQLKRTTVTLQKANN